MQQMKLEMKVIDFDGKPIGKKNDLQGDLFDLL